MALKLDPTGVFSFQESKEMWDVGCIVYSTCVLQKQVGQFPVGSEIEQITVEVKLHLEQQDGTKLLETQDLT